ncbi:MAG: tetratricopeptide repeat protein, partial [Isosphaeraceae bacterium]
MSARTGWFRLALAFLVTIGGPVLAGSAAARFQEPRQQGKADAKSAAKGKEEAAVDRAKAPAGAAARSSGWGPEMAVFFNQPGDDPPRPSMPLRPATVDDRRRLDAIRLFTAARGLEDRGHWNEAAGLLQDALKLDPDSVAIARRLSKLYIGALGRPDLALQYGRRVLTIEPEDSATLSKLVEFYSRRGETEAAEKLILEVLASPKLPARSPGRLVADFELGRLYSTRLNRLDRAAD